MAGGQDPEDAGASAGGNATRERFVSTFAPEVGPAVTDRGGDRGFDYEMIPGGYYDAVYRRRRGI